MGGLGGGIVFDRVRDIAVDGVTLVELQSTDEVLRITSAGNGPVISGFHQDEAFVIQDRLFLLVNLSGVTVDLGEDPPTAPRSDQIRRVAVPGPAALVNLRSVFMHYHIGTTAWYILTTVA